MTYGPSPRPMRELILDAVAFEPNTVGEMVGDLMDERRKLLSVLLDTVVVMERTYASPLLPPGADVTRDLDRQIVYVRKLLAANAR